MRTPEREARKGTAALVTLHSNPVDSARRPRDPTKWQMVFSTMGVAAIGIVQPILDLLGRTPDFFVARAAPGRDVVLLGILLGIAIPVALGGIVLLACHIRPSAGRVAHISVFTAMSSMVAISVIRLSPLNDQPWPIVAGLALAFGVFLTWCYYHSRAIRSALTFVGLAPLVVTAVFLFLSPTSQVAWGMASEAGSSGVAVGKDVPVVVVVFDELPIASLIDDQAQIDEEHFPGFAALSEDATWFRNAVGTREATRDALPTLLTGVSQGPGDKLPHHADHPDNLFTMFGGDYEVRAIETLTQLCPSAVCTDGSRDVDPFSERWASLGEDLSIVTGHLLLPGELSSQLPPIDQNWGDFAPESARPETWSIQDRMKIQLENDRRTEVNRFLSWLEEPVSPRSFHFVHVPLPHSSWIHMADGRTYPARPGNAGGANRGWGSNEFLVEQAYQRHFIQLQYVDSVVESIVRNLEETGSYDSSLLVVTADHGIAFRSNQLWRSIREETAGEIAAVPLFIKAPNQARGVIDDYRAELTDIVPTIAGFVDAEISWSVDGTDLFSSPRPERLETTMVGQEATVTFTNSGEEKLRAAANHVPYFGDRGPYGIAPLGYAELLGETVQTESGTQGAITAELDFPELYRDVDPRGDPLPILYSGILEGDVEPGEVLAVTVDLRVIALTESWDDDGTLRFQSLLPPEVFVAGVNDFGLYVVRPDGEEYTFSPVERP